MDLISDLERDLAFAFLVEKRYLHDIDSEDALALIGRVKTLLERTSVESKLPAERQTDEDSDSVAAAH